MTKTETVKVPGEGFVVTESGVRVDGRVHAEESVAQAEAAKRQKQLLRGKIIRKLKMNQKQI